MERYLKKLRPYLPQIIFCLAAVWLFWQIYPIIFATHDDLRNWTLVRRGTVFSDALASAKTGRISHLWNHILLAVPFLANKVWFYKLIQFSALLFEIYAGRKLLKAHAGRRFADLATVLAVSWACISAQHSLLIAYALCHQLPMGFACLSLYYFGNGLKKPASRDTAKCCGFLLAAVMIYEAFAAVLLLMLLWSLMHGTRKRVSHGQWFLQSSKQMLPQLCTVFGYSVIYFGWQLVFPTAYGGIAPDLREPFLSLSALKTYSLSAFPLSELTAMAKTQQITWGVFLRAVLHPLGWLTALGAAWLFYDSLPKVRMRNETLHNLLWLAGAGTFVPCLLVSFTEKYLDWLRQDVRGYLPSFYSFLFLTVFLAAAGVKIYRTAPEGHPQIAVRRILTAGVFCICLCATAVTQLWKPHFAELSLRYRNFNLAVSSELPSLSSEWQLYAPDNGGIHNSADYSEDYLKIYNSAEISYVHDAADLDDASRTLCIRMPEGYAFAVTGEADSDLRSKRLTFRTWVPEAFDITLYDTDGEPVYYNGVRNGNQLTLPDGKYFDLTVRVAGVAVSAAH